MKKRYTTIRTFISLGIGILIAIAIFLALLGWGAYEHYHAKWISVKKVYPPNAYNLTDDLEQYPVLEKAIELADGKIKLEVNLKEIFELKDELKGSNHIKVGEDYYRITLYDAILIRKLKHAENHVRGELPFLKEKMMYIDERKVAKVDESIESIDDDRKENIKMYGADIVVLNDGFILTNVSREEYHQTEEFVKNGRIIEFEGDYYDVFIETKLFLSRLEPPSECLKVIELSDLSGYPTLKRALDLAIESCEASLKTPPEEWEKTFDLMHGRGYTCIEVNGNYYEVGFATA